MRYTLELRPVLRLVMVAAALAGAVLLSACDEKEEPIPSRTVVGGRPELGSDLIRAYGCGNCHMIPGVRDADGTVGPPLIAFARRDYIAGAVANKTENLIRWIQNPPEVDPRTAMPVLGVSEQEARHIAAYLYTLR
jgi:cytochrome c